MPFCPCAILAGSETLTTHNSESIMDFLLCFLTEEGREGGGGVGREEGRGGGREEERDRERERTLSNS